MVSDERIKELKKLLTYAKDESEVKNYGIQYQYAALDLKVAITKMMSEINKYQILQNIEKDNG